MDDLIFYSYPIYDGNDLHVDSFGYQCFEKRQIFLPTRICKVHMLHYVIKGKGTLTLEDKTFPLKKGALFFCPPDVKLTYHTSTDEPYTYFWINFTGSAAESKVNALGLSKDNPVIYPQNAEEIIDVFRKLMPLANLSDTQDMALSCLFSLFYQAKDNKATPRKKQSAVYAEKAVEYISSNFSDPELRISHVAEELHVSIEYLSKIFKEETKTSPVSFLISKRMEVANKLLKQGLSVTETAVKCGYMDLCNFSKTYAKYYGYPPSKTF